MTPLFLTNARASELPTLQSLLNPLPASQERCFGIGCSRHGSCLRYIAIDGDTSDAPVLPTCVNTADRFPMFMEVRDE